MKKNHRQARWTLPSTTSSTATPDRCRRTPRYLTALWRGKGSRDSIHGIKGNWFTVHVTFCNLEFPCSFCWESVRDCQCLVLVAHTDWLNLFGTIFQIIHTVATLWPGFLFRFGPQFSQQQTRPIGTHCRLFCRMGKTRLLLLERVYTVWFYHSFSVILTGNRYRVTPPMSWFVTSKEFLDTSGFHFRLHSRVYQFRYAKGWWAGWRTWRIQAGVDGKLVDTDDPWHPLQHVV